MVIFVNRQIELVMKTLVSLLCCTALTVGSASAQSYRVARAGAFEENGRVEVGIPPSPLAVGMTVKAGDEVGLAGTTGVSTGPHLHFELWRNGEETDPMEALAS